MSKTNGNILSSNQVEVDTNSYCKLLHDISTDELFDGLLGYGLFAEKIPPFLTAEYFLDFCKDENNTNGLKAYKKAHKYVNYQNIRNTNIPRILGIPNPFAYYYQCKILSKNWDKLLKHFKEKTQEQKHKISRIHIRKLKDKKHLFEMNYKNFEVDDYPEPNLLIGKKYLVKADISNCFPSIYTHAIAWALTEKSTAKECRRDNNKYFNQIDEATRNLKDSETHGILIGCHSSNLISEIILTAIDKEMYNKNYSYIRNIDDYDCYVETMEKAEQFLIDLSMELRKYDLTLNLKKTKILSLPIASTEHWVRKLNLFLFHNQYPKDDTEKNNEIDFCTTRAYLDTALDLTAQNNENSAILKYAIKVIAKKKLSFRATQYFINTIHHLVLIYPYLIGMIDEYVFSIFKLPQNTIKAIATNIFEFGKKNAFEAMSYALYFALKYNFKIRDNLFEIVEKTDDAVLLLLAYLHDKKFIGNSAVKNYQKLAKSFTDNIDEYWLFVYEVLDEKSLKDDWKTIKQKGVSFIKKDFLSDATS
ncbi:RNA-directed DNA polymerase [Helicobacter sp. MIT 05-5294]|uniref:RNA-directed DNA polymerase n=1 Tax=Helicobacter sp. MIT 05-5294 TaxID=1548150 RepID=UPI0019310641|nr:RNA-directed DNA polymerase [Helicobacter sp. MIT 05-5294]